MSARRRRKRKKEKREKKRERQKERKKEEKKVNLAYLAKHRILIFLSRELD